MTAHLAQIGSHTHKTSNAMLMAAFATALLCSAFLMFSVQPLFSKMVLPAIGGSQAVWSFSLVFFQTVLLLGYAYAFALARWASPVLGLAIHGIVLAAGLTALPVIIPVAWAGAAANGEILPLAAVFGLGAGVPVFAISATAPLLQSWFARTGHPQANDPYFLYGASNIGSFAALAAYPFLIEPLTALSWQTGMWRMIYMALVAMILGCGFLSIGRVENKVESKDAAAAAPALSDRLRWIALSAVPSGLLVAVTAHIATDLVSAPFIWVVPLALFLVTFVIVFQRKPLLSHDRILWFHSAAVAPFAGALFLQAYAFINVSIHLLVFFISAMVCHGELVKRRPAASRLTEFYLLMSVGGVIGGIFASLAAPFIFNRIYEYPILLTVVFACRADFWQAVKSGTRLAALPGLAAIVLIACAATDSGVTGTLNDIAKELGNYVVVAVMLATFMAANNRLAQAGFVAIAVVFTSGFGVSRDSIATVRSMFGVHMVLRQDDGKFHILAHGTTLHGAQRWQDANGLNVSSMPRPAAYYYEGGPFVEAINAVRGEAGSLPNVAVIGLGTGALACQQRGNETWRFYEIDKEVIRIARNPEFFTYLAECGEGGGIITGDGRLALAAERPAALDLIIIDAFSSDSIPTHLLTAEAFDLYRSKLKPDGVMLFHLSNRYMELGSVVAAIAKSRGEAAWFNKLADGVWPVDAGERQTRPWIAAVARNSGALGVIATDQRWARIDDASLTDPWTDDFSNVLGAIVRMYKVGGLEGMAH